MLEGMGRRAKEGRGWRVGRGGMGGGGAGTAQLVGFGFAILRDAASRVRLSSEPSGRGDFFPQS